MSKNGSQKPKMHHFLMKNVYLGFLMSWKPYKRHQDKLYQSKDTGDIHLHLERLRDYGKVAFLAMVWLIKFVIAPKPFIF